MPESEVAQGNPHDIVEIFNSDINCTLEDPEIHPQGKNSVVIHFGRRSEAPTVIHIEAGKTRLVPRYLGEHFKNHLTDHLLTVREKTISDPVERPKIEKEIFLGIKEDFGEVNPPIRVEDRPLEESVVIEPPSVVTTTVLPTAEVSTSETTATSETKPVEDQEASQPLPTRKELFNELKVLGVETTGKENVATLMKMIEEFAYGKTD